MNTDQLVELKVDGMSCANCAATVQRRLERSGLTDVRVEFSSGEVSFTNVTALSVDQIKEQIDELGYHVVQTSDDQKKKD